MKSKPMNARAELIDLNKQVSAALAKANEGQLVDLTGLDERADRLCEYLLALPALEARPYAERLESLIGDMNSLEEALSARFGKIMAQAAPAGAHAPK